MSGAAERYRDWSIVNGVGKAGPLLRRGDYDVGPPIGERMPVQLHANLGQIDRCIRRGYLETFEQDGHQFVRVSERGHELLREVEAAREEHARRAAGAGQWWLDLVSDLDEPDDSEE